MQPGASRNSDKRESVMLRAMVWTASARTPSEHRIRNLSLSGACILHSGKLTRGDRIRVTIGQAHDLDAVVMWVAEGAAGIRFEEPIDLAAARRSRSAGIAQAGWIGGMRDVYRR